MSIYGTLTVITGPMFAGKTSELQRHILWDIHRKRKILVYKPSFDNRYHETKIVTHDGDSIDAIAISSVNDILVSNTVKTVYFDEIQFFMEPMFTGDLVEAICGLLNRGIDVTVNGLNADWRGEPFAVMTGLLPRADHIIKKTAMCSVCGKPATKTHKFSVDGESVALGADDVYTARCNYHWRG